MKSLLRNWVVLGLVWGIFMFLFMGIAVPMAENDTIVFPGVLIKLVVWLISGLGYGYFMYRWGGLKKKEVVKQD